MYDIWMRCYPQANENISEMWEMPPVETLQEANAIIKELETNYADNGWCGHRMYKAKFYAMEAEVIPNDLRFAGVV